MSVAPVSILSSEQVVNVKYMFDETIIEKLNLLMHSHAIAEKDTKQHRELANFKERCVDDHGKDKCDVNPEDDIGKQTEIINNSVSESMGEQGNLKDEFLRYRETLLLQFLEYHKKHTLKSHLFVVFGGKVENEDVYKELHGDETNNNWVYRMDVEKNMNNLPREFEGLFNKIKDKFIKYKEAKRDKGSRDIDVKKKPFESIVFLKASKSNYSVDFSHDKRLKTMPALISRFEKEIKISQKQSKKLDEEIQKFIDKHKKYDFTLNEQQLVKDRNSTTGSSEIMAMDLTNSKGSSSFQDLVKVVDVNHNDLRKNFHKYILKNRELLFTENKKHFLFNFFNNTNEIMDETINELATLKRTEGKESFATYFHRMSIYLLQKYFNFYVLKQPMMSDMFPLVSKGMKSFQVNVNINYISKVKKDDKYYDKHIVPTDLKYPETNQNKTRAFHFKITNKEREEYTIQSIGSMIGKNLYPVEIVKKPGNKEVPIKYSMILKTKDLPLMVELKLQENQANDKVKQRIKGLLFVDEAIQTTDKTLHEMKPSKIYPTNKANHFFYKPKFEANQRALAEYLKKSKLSADEYKKQVCDVFTNKENLSKFYIFCENNPDYIYLTEKPEEYNSKLSVLRCLLQPNSCYYHKKKSTSIEDELDSNSKTNSKDNSTKNDKAESDQTTSQCNYMIHSVDYLNPNIKDLDEKKAIKEQKKREEEEEKKREDEMFFKDINENIQKVKDAYEQILPILNRYIQERNEELKRQNEELARLRMPQHVEANHENKIKKLTRSVKNIKEDIPLKTILLTEIQKNNTDLSAEINQKDEITHRIPENTKLNSRIIQVMRELARTNSSLKELPNKYDNATKSLRDALKRITLSSSGKCSLVSLGSPNKKKCSEYSNKGEEKEEEKEIDIVIHVFRTPEKKPGSKKDEQETCETRQSVLKDFFKHGVDNVTQKAKLIARQQFLGSGKRRTIRRNKKMKMKQQKVRKTRKRVHQSQRSRKTRKTCPK